MTAMGERLAGELPNATGGAPAPRRILPRKLEPADIVIGLSGALVLIIFVIFALLCVQGYATTVNSAKTRAQTAADIIAQQAEWMVGGALASLGLVESRLALTPAAIEPEDKAELDTALKALPDGADLAIYDAQGVVVPNGGAPSLPADIAQTPYFAALANGQDWTIAPQQADATSGTPTMVVARRLGGEVFAGIAALSLKGEILRDFWEPQGLGEASTVSIVRADGLIVARYPALDAAMNLAAVSPQWPQIAAADSGTYEGRSPADGIARVVAFRHIEKYGLITFGSVSQDAILSGLWSSIFIVLLLLVPIALALIGGSFLTARLLRQSGKNERKLAAAVAHNEVLFREIHHRVKNNLQSVASLLQMQPIPREIKVDMGQRLAAMSAVHEHIYRSSNFETVDVKGYLQTLIDNIRAGHDPNVEVVVELEDIAVDKDAATPLGLILNEVASNAFKHAFADGRPGIVTVMFKRTTEGLGQLTVEDNGVGFDPAQPAKGIGRRLIAALTQQLGGQSHFETAPSGGSLFRLTFPLH